MHGSCVLRALSLMSECLSTAGAWLVSIATTVRTTYVLITTNHPVLLCISINAWLNCSPQSKLSDFRLSLVTSLHDHKTGSCWDEIEGNWTIKCCVHFILSIVNATRSAHDAIIFISGQWRIQGWGGGVGGGGGAEMISLSILPYMVLLPPPTPFGDVVVLYQHKTALVRRPPIRLSTILVQSCFNHYSVLHSYGHLVVLKTNSII